MTEKLANLLRARRAEHPDGGAPPCILSAPVPAFVAPKRNGLVP